MSSLISMKNIGKEIAIKLESVNIDSPEKLIKLGAEKSFLMLKESYPKICLVYLYVLYGAIADIEYTKIPDERKKQLKEFSDSLKNIKQSKVI
ncbi:TfoX/Sxy family DNA transformation protein [uncultured Brachyspira sp.]|uniref:TfoX/Sxy family DNA transformation protein n=1 Tax=uncultured Brachyspira sp. TaxID=221953 RepID=UPI0025EC1261|nr:TfoX/Sxy family DNA transformation protein [uncultured Brachyspira sp.]